MKITFRYILMLAVATSAFSCKKDNYTAPSSVLSGHLVYQGEAIQVERNQVPFQLYQYGFGKVGAINQSFAQDGSYSAILFDGDYKFIIPNGQGPFLSKPDSIAVSLHGSQTLDIDVTPYYMIRTPQITASSGSAVATFKIEKVVTDANAKDIERVTLYLNKTQFVSGGDNIASTTINGADIADVNSVTISTAIPTIVPSQNYVFARIGLKVAGVEDLIFSPLIKVTY